MAKVAILAATLVLAACQQAATSPETTTEQLAASAMARRNVPVNYNHAVESDICDPTIRNPYLVAECHDKLVSQGKAVAPLEPEIQRQLAINHQRQLDMAAAEQQAHAQCSYQAQMANLSTPGLITGLFNGIGAGLACEQYYRAIGVMP